MKDTLPADTYNHCVRVCTHACVHITNPVISLSDAIYVHTYMHTKVGYTNI